MRERNELNLANVKLVEMGASKILRFPPNIPLLLFDSMLINLLKINRWKSQNIVTSLSILLLLKGSMEFFYLIKPRVFLLHVKDLPNTSSLLTYHLFADDTNIYFSRKNLSHLETTLNRKLKSVAEWMKCNRLALSISETNFILFHSSKLKPNQSLN